MSDGQRQNWDDASVGEYALGVMPHTERLRFAMDLKTNRSLQMRLAVWEENFAPMSGELADVTPPPFVFDKIEKQLFPTAKSLPLFQRLGFWQAATAIAFAGLALFVALPAIKPTTQINAPLVAVIQGETLLVSASFDASINQLKISLKRGTKTASEDFELWAIVAGNAPVSLGVLQDGTITTVQLPENLKTKIAGSTLAITNEPKGGSPNGKPTGTILGSGTIIEI